MILIWDRTDVVWFVQVVWDVASSFAIFYFEDRTKCEIKFNDRLFRRLYEI